MLYCTNHKKPGETAGAKAPDDISEIARQCGAEDLMFRLPPQYRITIVTRFFALFTGLKNWCNLLKTAECGSTIILQHPNENILVANKFIDICKRKKDLHFVMLIHDLDSIRKSLLYKEDVLKNRNQIADEVLLKKCDYVICHNEAMRSYLIGKGMNPERLVTLGIFDYLHNCDVPASRKKEASVVVAGNLLRGKCEYLYKLMAQGNPGFTLELFGPNFLQENIPEFVNYHGVCKPDELPGKLEGSFGLVWDGTEVERCAGNAGEYIRYNNPHKCSLFLASNMPVIIWEEAALAPFIRENGLGITVKSLLDIGKAIEQLTEEEYAQICKNVCEMGKKLRNGQFTERAFRKIQ